MNDPQDASEPSQLDRLLGDVDGIVDGSGRHALLSFADREAEALVRDQLSALGYRLQSVHRSYAVLDELASRDYDVLVSEIELWEDDGRVLRERVGRPGGPRSVVFIGDRSERAGRTPPSIGFLERPLAPRQIVVEVSRAVTAAERDDSIAWAEGLDFDLVDAALLDDDDLAGLSGWSASSLSETPEPPVDGTDSAIPADPPQAAAVDGPCAVPPAADRAVSSDGPSARDAVATRAADPLPLWWKFFFEARRACRVAAAREPGDVDASAIAFLNVFREVLDPLAVCLVEMQAAGPRFLLDDAAPRDPVAAGAAAHVWSDFFSVLFGPRRVSGVVRVAAADADGRWVLLIHFGVRSVEDAGATEEMCDELSVLLGEVVGGR